MFFKVLMGCRPTIPEHMPEAFQKLMVECWDTDADKRPTFEEVLQRLQVCTSLPACLQCLDQSIPACSEAQSWLAHHHHHVQSIMQRRPISSTVAWCLSPYV